jgi:hypothetical protein
MSKTFSELLGKFLTDEKTRCPIIKDHDKGLTAFGMSAEHVQALGTMDAGEIVPYVLAELTNKLAPADRVAFRKLIQAIKVKHDEVFPSHLTPQEITAAAAAYGSGGVHIFEVSPKTAHAGSPTQIVIRGNGYDCERNIEVRFVEVSADTLTVTAAEVLSLTADEDLNERVTVKVTFPRPGEWLAEIRNTSAPGSGWSGNRENKNKVLVVA